MQVTNDISSVLYNVMMGTDENRTEYVGSMQFQDHYVVFEASDMQIRTSLSNSGRKTVC